MPFVQVHLLEGRTEKEREKIAKAFTDALVEILGVPREIVWIQFIDMPKSYFAVGGVLKSRETK
ncbi:MAG: tautomerase family protein [Candidatus Bathyarchaeia archaeon]|nr:tautomerase family protein [Candidatus Bathyarchaeota archaeon]